MLSVYLSVLDSQEDKDGFAGLYKQYRHRMYHIAFAVLKDRNDAEDAVSEAFLRIARSYKKISALDCKKQEGYIVILCRNTALEIYRRRKREAEHIAGGGELLESLSFEDEDSSRLTEAIARLPKEHKDALYIYCIFGCSAEEAASRLGISKGALYTRVSRAKAELKKLLRGDEDE